MKESRISPTRLAHVLAPTQIKACRSPELLNGAAVACACSLIGRPIVVVEVEVQLLQKLDLQ